MIWSRKYNISEYINAPMNPGVYMLGIPNGLFRQPGEKEDNYFGENYPEDFEPMYVGISKWSVRVRLYSHYKGLGNKNVRDYIRTKGSINVFFVYYESTETEIEDVFLISMINGFPWNKKRRENGNLIKRLLKIVKQ